jgi:hypothetical protein
MAPFVLFFTVISQFTPGSFWRAWPAYAAGEFWLQLVKQLCPVYTAMFHIAWAVMAIRRDPRFVCAWQLGYIGSIAGAAVRWPLCLLYGYPRGVSLASNIFVAVGSTAGFLLLTLYYTRSVRVRTYMGTEKYLRLAFFTKKVKGPAPAVPDETGREKTA